MSGGVEQRPSTGNMLAKWAVWYARRGLRVFPCWPETKAPRLGAGGLHKATSDTQQVERWWRQWPDCSIGVVAPLDVVIIDVDSADGHGVDGVAALAALVAEHGELPETPRARSGSGGAHIWFRLPEGVKHGNSPGDLPDGLDVRGGGNGYVIVPPSWHTQAKRAYSWDAGRGIHEVDIAEAPAWLMNLIKPPRKRPAPSPPGGVVVPMPIPTTDNYRLRKYSEAALRRACDSVAGAMQSRRHGTLNQEAHGLGKIIGAGGLEEHEVTMALMEAAAACGMLDEGREKEVRRTIAQGIEAGRGKASELPADVLYPPAAQPAGRAGKNDDRKLLWGFIPTDTRTIRWLGAFCAMNNAEEAVAKTLPDELLDDFGSGINSAGEWGGTPPRPDTLTRAQVERIRRRVKAAPTKDPVKTEDFAVTIERLVRRPVLHRATFDLVVGFNGKTAELRRLASAELTSYKLIRDRTLEAGVLLPQSSKESRGGWEEALEAALVDVEVVEVDPEECSQLAVLDVVRNFLMTAEDDGDDLAHLVRGGVVRTAEGRIYALPRRIVEKVRVSLPDDKPPRTEIVDAARMLGMTDKRPLLSDNNRPRVWCFPPVQAEVKE